MRKSNTTTFLMLLISWIFINFLLFFISIDNVNTLKQTIELEIQNNNKQLTELQLEINKLKTIDLNDLSIKLDEYNTTLNIFSTKFNSLVTENF